MNFKNIFSDMHGLQDAGKKTGIKIITLIVFCLYLLFLKDINMVPEGGDAADIWHTITSWNTDNVYRSYVMYKGFFSVHPYYELYRLAVLIGINELFFIKILYALMFAYVTTIGFPVIAQKIVGVSEGHSLAILCFSGICFYFWNKSGALRELFIDLPSIFCIIIAIQFFLVIIDRKFEDQKVAKRIFYLFICSFMLAAVASMSGQYIVSVGLLAAYIVMILLQRNRINEIVFLGSIYALITVFTKIWYRINVQSYGISSGGVWLRRGLLYMMNIDRLYGSSPIDNARGFAICADYFGSNEAAVDMLMKAGMGTEFWSVSEYLKIVLRYPVDFIAIYIERFFLLLSYDGGNPYLGFASQYFLLSFSVIIIWRLLNRKRWFDMKFIIIMACFASVIPALVLTVEMRYGLLLQGLIWALPIFLISGRIKSSIDGSGCMIISKKELLFILGFSVFCMVYMCEIYAQGVADLKPIR